MESSRNPTLRTSANPSGKLIVRKPSLWSGYRTDCELSGKISLRRAFEPMGVALVIVAESPPVSGKYFYDPDGEVSEPL